MKLFDLRREYESRPLHRRDLDPDPLQQFERWFLEARQHVELDPNAMCLSTVGSDGRPSARMVLLKSYDVEGFVFFTNLQSRKAREIDGNPHVALLFFWAPLSRQVVIEGTAERISTAEAVAYFVSRPRGSQIGAWVSEQSRPILSRALLEAKWEEMKQKFAEGEIPLPSFWGGYRVRPHRYEFWQGRENRLHDRFEYLPQAGGGWQIQRLQP
ncbi:MAG: pyridoxamine 5'-phosphate oxidase [Verrucomicrobiota bacterium]|nr:pyridoxamine 5'-phosphate oxidase [Limisphaera sp.]MDW8381707.1 pyridoxamine 5'-phosphate oxidase [Verrucomicrobiota bacterium]